MEYGVGVSIYTGHLVVWYGKWTSDMECGSGWTDIELLVNGAVPPTPPTLPTFAPPQEAGAVLNEASRELEDYHGPQLSLLRTFYLTTQVTHLLMAGQVSRHQGGYGISGVQ